MVGDSLHALSRGSAGTETVAALLVQAWAMAHLGKLQDARSILAKARTRSVGESRREWLAEAAEIETCYGDESVARSLVDEADALMLNPSLAAVMTLTRVQLALREQNFAVAKSHLPLVRPSVPTLEFGYLSRYLSLRAHCAILAMSDDARGEATEALAFAERQGAGRWSGYCKVLLATLGTNIDAGLKRIASDQGPVYFSMVAELLLASLHRMGETSRDLIASEAQARPERWRPSVRRVVADENSPDRMHAARLLDGIGEQEDVPLLRTLARASRSSRADSTLGKGLARRLAASVCVEDQGRVEIHVGSTVISGTDLRRKVLAMLCFLLTRSKFSATRDEMRGRAVAGDGSRRRGSTPSIRRSTSYGASSNRATRRTLSAGYVHHDSDVLWLDPELIQSRSQACRELIDALGPSPRPEDVDMLSDSCTSDGSHSISRTTIGLYPYRDALHVAYLQVIEGAVNRDIETGHYERGIRLARRALSIDPDLESLELSLLRLYRVTGAHSAAAEQYAHYAAYLRDELGVEPPPLASI